jgi:hypothetical protein
MKLTVSTVFERRSRNGTWIFVVGAVLTTLLVLSYLADSDAPSVMAFWALLPLSVFIVHIRYRTIAGWAIISIPWLLYTAYGWHFLLDDVYGLISRRQGFDATLTPGWIVVGVFTGFSLLLMKGYPRIIRAGQGGGVQAH